MGTETLKFGNIEIEKKKFTAIRLLSFLKDVDIEKGISILQVLLLVTCIMLLKLGHYI